MKKKISIDEEVLEDLDFLICQHLKDNNITIKKINEVREIWIKQWINNKMLKWQEEQNK